MVNLVDDFSRELEIRSSFPHQTQVRVVRIPLSDGVELAARLWVPVDAERVPVPAIMEYIPYRQRDYTALRDALIHPWFAGHGYASLRVDLRGSGDSSGDPMDEYVTQELDDAVEALAWVAAQPWCCGATGMMGISWGGFNALQVAALRPPSLKAIVTVCSTDDRYNDDVHYLGGCLLSDNFTWGSLLYANMGRPPDPDVVGETWRSQWLQRLQRAPLALVEWLTHQHRDSYWKHGTVCESYQDIECPVYAVGGWADSYTNAIPRLMSQLNSPHRAVIGPWGHAYPHLATPGPRIGFLQQATRWWDHWLKDIDNGIDHEPMLKLWVQESVPPGPSYAERPGYWIEETQWPPANVEFVVYQMDRLGLANHATGTAKLAVQSPVDLGVTGGEWMALGAGAEMPLDQRSDDGGSLTFDSPLLDRAVTIAGSPVAHLHLESSAPVAQVAVRLGDVFPDGRVTRVTYGILNLTHREGHENPAPLEPGVGYGIDVGLKVIVQTIPAGHRLRVSISTGYWPMVWPSPTPAILTLDTGKCHLTVPVLDCGARKKVVPDPPAIPMSPLITWSRPLQHQRTIARDAASGMTTLIHSRDEGAFKIEEHGMEVDARGTERHWITTGDPLSAGSRVQWRLTLSRGEWRCAVECELEQTATSQAFLIRARVDAYEGDTRVFTRSSHHRLPRKLV